MTYVTGLFLIDANASALNNLGAIEGERYDNSCLLYTSPSPRDS